MAEEETKIFLWILPGIATITPFIVLSVAELLGEGIKRIHNNASVTGLFDIKGF